MKSPVRKVGRRRFRVRTPFFDMFVTFNLLWRSKPRPYWFRATYPGDRGWTVQFPFFEFWGR